MSSDEISRVRSFSRSVTRRVGVFTDHFLGRKRPLAEARLIFEIGLGGRNVRELRARMGFDSGYLSRLLRSLEKQGLVEVAPLARDRRIRSVLLTPEGQHELEHLNRLGDDFAASVLAPLSDSQRRRLTQAMEEVERLLQLSATTIAVEDPDGADALRCIERYFAELAERFEDGFDAGQSISADPDELRPPKGAFLVARLDGAAVGCGALKVIAPGVGSIKRMWVDQTARGLGLGRRILEALEEQAAELGLHTVRLETNRSLHAAQKLYRSSGYREVAAFNDDPYADFWFEKTI